MKKPADFNFPCQPGFPSRLLKSALAASAALIALAALTTGAQAASPEYCAYYARTAVAQYRAYVSIPGCFEGPSNRWGADYGGHNSWCLLVGEDLAERETYYRSGVLEECKARAGRY